MDTKFQLETFKVLETLKVLGQGIFLNVYKNITDGIANPVQLGSYLIILRTLVQGNYSIPEKYIGLESKIYLGPPN